MGNHLTLYLLLSLLFLCVTRVLRSKLKTTLFLKMNSMEFESGIQELAIANFSEIERFINLLTSLTKDGLKRLKDPKPELVSKIHSMQNKLVHVLFVLKKSVYDSILKNQAYHITLHANKIMDQDVDFFYDRPQIFGNLPDEDVNIFRDVYTDSGLNDDDKNQIWGALKTFLIMACIYQGKFKAEIVNRFSAEMNTFFALLKQHCVPGKLELLQSVQDTFNEENDDYAPEVALMCISNQLLLSKKTINECDTTFFTTNKNGFLVRDDVPRDWMSQVLPKDMSGEAGDYVWGYLNSLLVLSTEFVTEPERWV